MSSAFDISIIIPAYNRLWCLPEAIESCRGAVCKIEIIVIDDGSTDGTLQWLEKQPDIIVVKQSNSGKCAAVNSGFKIAKGKYIRFLDSDDMLAEDANDEQFALAVKTGADIVVSGTRDFYNGGQTLYTRCFVDTDDFIAQQLGEGYGSHYSAFIFKKEFLEDIPHNPEFAYRDDRLLILEAALKNPFIAVHPGIALAHRLGHNDRLQITQGVKQRMQNYQQLMLYKRIVNQLADENRLTKRRIEAAAKVLWTLAHWIAIYNLTEAKEVVNWIYELNPEFIIPEKGALGFFYNKAGFTATEKLLRIRRIFKGRVFNK
ncbi:glycosyltransferase family 2 protein [Mucilaginibacter sp.]|uniref:glycosyltransferase family 2 protein n=1 Tax=Mucilaginibacter sp. TaxID=1882438 RepID=UPI0025D662DB|nr:glycosyltransferase family 2 protein [Mucilaginibacter sp.]